MHPRPIGSRATYAVTVAVWLALCFRFWRRLVARAASDPETYTHGRVFQLLNFVLQYLWVFLVALVIVLAVEWLVFKVAGALVARRSARAS